MFHSKVQIGTESCLNQVLKFYIPTYELTFRIVYRPNFIRWNCKEHARLSILTSHLWNFNAFLSSTGVFALFTQMSSATREAIHVSTTAWLSSVWFLKLVVIMIQASKSGLTWIFIGAITSATPPRLNTILVVTFKSLVHPFSNILSQLLDRLSLNWSH